MRLACFVLALAMPMQPTLSMAEDLPTPVGPASITCGQFVRYHRNPAVQLVMLTWTECFLYAWNNKAEQKRELTAITIEDQGTRLLEYCTENPRVQFPTAVEALYLQFPLWSKKDQQ